MTTEDLIRTAAARGYMHPDVRSLRASHTRLDGSVVSVRLSETGVPGVRRHTRAIFYIDGRRVSRATAAVALQNDEHDRRQT